MTVNRPLNIDLREEHEIFNLDLCAILVARYTAVLCFKGTGDDTPQEMIAIDLTPGKHNNSCKFDANFLFFWCLYHLIFDLETIGDS